MSDRLVIVTSEGERVEIDSRIQSMSNLIHSILLDAEPNEEIQLSKLNRHNLDLILEYCIKHNFEAPAPISKPLPTDQLREVVSEWDFEFLSRLSEEELIELVNVVDYLDIKCILELCLAKIACQFKNKDIEVIRKEYGIEEEYTEEIDEALKREFPWALEGEEVRFEAS